MRLAHGEVYDSATLFGVCGIVCRRSISARKEKIGILTGIDVAVLH